MEFMTIMMGLITTPIYIHITSVCFEYIANGQQASSAMLNSITICTMLMKWALGKCHKILYKKWMMYGFLS